MKRRLRAGTRGSKLARRQTAWVIARIQEKYPELEIDEVVISTKGDRDRSPFSQLTREGDMGLFTKELEKALLNGEIDLAVHSLKDLPVVPPQGLILGAVPERATPFDAVVTRDGIDLMDLPSGSRLGTSSLRRSAQIRHNYPDFIFVDLRGNLDTRIRKLQRGEVDAVILAAAGLIRLGYRENCFSLLDPAICLPAPGQGALAVEIREKDSQLREVCRLALDDQTAYQAVAAERAFLQALGGGCRIPLGAYARLEGGTLLLQGAVAAPDGSRVLRGETAGSAGRPQEVGRALAEILIEKGAKEILAGEGKEGCCLSGGGGPR